MSTELGRLGSYRVGDDERARTVDLLKEAHVAGYLTLPEIDERLSVALAARTRNDLERLLADLPPEWRARQEGEEEPVPARPGVRAVVPALRLLALFLVVGVVLLVVTRGFFFFPWPLLWVFFFAFGRHHHRPGGWQGRDSNRVTWI
jgi:Domain of unknown function (DUF1707)